MSERWTETPCPVCDGQGAYYLVAGHHTEVLPSERCTLNLPPWAVEHVNPCDTCQGKGYLIEPNEAKSTHSVEFEERP